MIRYAVSVTALRARLEADSPGWLDRAKARTATFRVLGRYQETDSDWSAIKPTYMHLQGNGKCAYCERKLESVDFGRVEQDVEHFRPKGSVKAWPGRSAFVDIPFAEAPSQGIGYHLLPYHPLNYAAACKPCNSTLKKDYFPVAAAHWLSADDPAAMSREKAYLIYPIGSIDTDPERLVAFDGVSPRPVARRGHARLRALVTIAFFKLGDEARRKNLFVERANLLIALHSQLEKADDTRAAARARARAREVAEAYERSDKVPHSNCIRSFVRLYRDDPAQARAFYEAAQELVLSSS